MTFDATGLKELRIAPFRVEYLVP